MISGAAIEQAEGIERLGAWWKILLAASLIALTAAVGFLSWIWWEDRNDMNRRRLMLGSFSTRAITITAIATGIAIATLAAITTSMLAALIIERCGVPLEHAAEISIAQSGTSVPEGLWKQLIGRGTMGKSTRILLMILLLTSFASQLASTLLLTDLLDCLIVTIPHMSLLGVGFQDIDGGGNPKAIPTSYNYTFNYVKWKPSSFETFAEHNVPPISRDGLDDTGVSL